MVILHIGNSFTVAFVLLHACLCLTVGEVKCRIEHIYHVLTHKTKSHNMLSVCMEELHVYFQCTFDKSMKT